MAEVHVFQGRVWITVRDLKNREHVVFETGDLKCPPGRYRDTGPECDRITTLSQPRRDRAQSLLRIVHVERNAGSVQYILTADRQEHIIRMFEDARHEIVRICRERPDVLRQLGTHMMRGLQF